MLNDRQEWSCVEPQAEKCSPGLDGMRHESSAWLVLLTVTFQVRRVSAGAGRSSSTPVILITSTP